MTPAVFLCLCQLSSAAVPAGPSVLLVTVDTLRADRVTAEKMPKLWALAQSGARYRRAYADVPLTLPSHATILTGVGVAEHGVRDNVGYSVPLSLQTLAQHFGEAGYATAAFVSGFPLRRGSGVERGFDLYDDDFDATPYGAGSEHLERRAPQTVARARAWLQAHRGRWFAWVHLFDPHTPYDAPVTSGQLPYDAEVARVDAAIAQLVDAARRSTPDTWVAIVGDHGEGLGDHFEETHGVFLYDETMRVPLVLQPPGRRPGRVIDRVVSTADVAPTLLAAAGLRGGGEGLGLERGYSELWRARAPSRQAAERVLYMESTYGTSAYRLAALRAALRWPLKCIQAPIPEAYDLSRDPNERINMMSVKARQCTALLKQLPPLPSASTEGPTAAERAALEALGYVGSTSTGPDALACAGCPDAKTVAAAIPLIEAGHEAVLRGELDRAQPLLQRAIAIDARNPVALIDLGNIAARRADWARAEELYRRALVITPNAAKLLTSLGTVVSKRGEHAAAVVLHRRALALDPQFHPARFNLAIALHRLGSRAAAISELERVQREAPELPGVKQTLRQLRALSR